MIPRYTRPKFASLWSLDNRYRVWLAIEKAVAQAEAELSIIPKESADKILSSATFDVARIEELDKTLRHDVIAFVTNVAESVGPDGRYVHFGLTSYDVVDTGLALLLREAGEELSGGLNDLLAVVRDLAEEHRSTLTVGRTHGVHAEPITFGLKATLWYAELQRNQDRLSKAIEEISVGKLSGAVGNFAHLSPRVERRVCEILKLKPESVATQVVSRDRHAYFISVLALIATTIEKIALEIRHLQRTEVREVEEPFAEGQKGSSAMPHKRNPVLCENLTGLSRWTRSQLSAAYENVALWHERDISHSSVERMLFPDVTTTVDFMIDRLIYVLKNLRVFPERMAENLESLKGIVFSQKVLLALTHKGMSRSDAYELIQQCAFELWNGSTGLHFRDILKRHSTVKEILSSKEIEQLFDYQPFLTHIGEIYERVFKDCKKR